MERTATSVLQDLFEKQRQYSNYYFDHLDLLQSEKALQACLDCKGLLIFTGIGKSGIVAEKIAMTLVSVGTRALFLPATNFLHGDIGAIGKEDLVIMLSKSGETQELLTLVPHIRKKQSRILALVSDEESKLARYADLYVHLPVEKELCPFDLAPTTSTAVQLFFGDSLAMALMRKKNIRLEQYASNHPSGSIGKKSTLIVEDLMRKEKDIPLCKPSDRLIDVIVELSNKKCGCLLIVSEDQELHGIFTDGDLRRALQTHGAKVMESSLESLMTPNPISVTFDELAKEAKKKMQKERYVMAAPVIQNKKVVGIIRMHDIIREGI